MAVVAVLFLLAPRPQPSDAPGGALNYVALNEHLGYVRSADSRNFALLAADPLLLLTPHEGRQSRPLFIVAAWALRAVLVPLMPVPAPNFLLTPGDLAFVIINFVVLSFAVVAFQALFPNAVWPFGVVAIAVLLVANDVVKTFFWTPHTQMCNLLAPAVTMLVCRRVLLEPDVGPRTLLLLGLGGGALMLGYGSFMIMLPAVIVALAIARASAPEPPAFLGQVRAFVIGFVAPTLMWIAIVTMHTGEFYSDEISHYRQFVWLVSLIDFLKQGLLWVAISYQLKGFLSATWQAAWFSVALAVPIAVVASWTGIRPVDVAREHKPTLMAAAITFVFATIFIALLGTYIPRISWNLVPPVLAVITATGSTLEGRLPPVGGRVLNLCLFLTVAGWLAYEIFKRGPFF